MTEMRNRPHDPLTVCSNQTGPSEHAIEDVGRQLGPDRVILFGSRAEGRAAADSDVDLLVIVPFDRRPFDESVAIRLAEGPFPGRCACAHPRNDRVMPSEVAGARQEFGEPAHALHVAQTVADKSRAPIGQGGRALKPLPP